MCFGRRSSVIPCDGSPLDRCESMAGEAATHAVMENPPNAGLGSRSQKPCPLSEDGDTHPVRDPQFGLNGGDVGLGG